MDIMNVTTAHDGSAVVIVDGARQQIAGEDLDAVRRKVLATARARAAERGQEVAIVSADPDGVWTVIVTPDGAVHDPAHPPAVVDTPPAPTPRRRRRGRMAPTPAAPERLPLAPRPIPPTPARTPPAVDVDERTVRAAPRPATPSVTLVFDSGQRVHITGTAYVGRRPTNSSSIPAELHAIDDESRNLSRTHFLIAWNGDRVGLLDQDSVNGTVIERAGTEPITARPGYATILHDGDRLRFGDTTATVAITTRNPTH
jgi:pSer/pThr/pTyr-binding forkhead associated (FHA) protein